FGMVQVSPDTGGQGGYDYSQNAIYGFSQTHLSGVGCGVMGELPVMPTTGAVGSVDKDAYRSEYSHAGEQATPGYYRVGLKTYGINAELTATPRTGWQRYTFPSTNAANVLFNTGQANQSVKDSEIHVVGDRTLEGRVRAGGFCAGHDEHTVYFTAAFDRPFASFGTWRGTHERQTAFYTALYHAQRHPNLAGDVDNAYAGFDGRVHTADGYTPYQNFSLWDTYRPQNQLLELLVPEVARDVARSIVAIGR